MYDSGTKRFNAVDVVKGNVEEPRRYNRYVYCTDNPINYTDPTGEEAKITTPPGRPNHPTEHPSSTGSLSVYDKDAGKNRMIPIYVPKIVDGGNTGIVPSGYTKENEYTTSWFSKNFDWPKFFAGIKGSQNNKWEFAGASLAASMLNSVSNSLSITTYRLRVTISKNKSYSTIKRATIEFGMDVGRITELAGSYFHIIKCAFSNNPD